MANWRFNSQAVLNMVNAAEERNAAEDRLRQQLEAEYENYRLLREHQAQMQRGEQVWRTGERREGQEFQTGERIGEQRWRTGERLGTQEWGTSERLGGQRFTSGENRLNRNLEREMTNLRMSMPVYDVISGQQRGWSSPYNTYRGEGLLGFPAATMENMQAAQNWVGANQAPKLPMARPSFPDKIADWLFEKSQSENVQSFGPAQMASGVGYGLLNLFGMTSGRDLDALNEERRKFNVMTPMERIMQLYALPRGDKEAAQMHWLSGQ